MKNYLYKFEFFSGNNFAKKGSKKNPESFTLYQKPMQLSNLTIQNIADQYIEFVREIELKMNSI